ncbi:tyrosine-protein phosphatase 99A-like [Pollicipes pollicipes]|uniref:tyrosine-protein phosphatase 99A-like n=1 Tax=Pollicipes pollicipes TaxID=41117 RepID=UPI001884D517|nr:tyrosine-protein phosphatase 99A-like [Pollicipes pollicipes]
MQLGWTTIAEKNRCQDINAYAHSLVPLRPLPGQRQGEHIDANYIDGFLFRNQYIGVRTPLTGSLAAFWRLIWEQRVQIVIMITSQAERNRNTYNKYWPLDGKETHGLIEVEHLQTRRLASYTVRKFVMKHAKQKSRAVCGGRVIYEYHYTSWPAEGVPDQPLSILRFVRKTAAANSGDGAGPILIHCRAGADRTGVYVVLDAMMSMLRLRSAVNVFGFLKHIGTQRGSVVPTEEQYVFVHDALLEALEAGETDVPASRLGECLHRLRSCDPGHHPRPHARPPVSEVLVLRAEQLVTSYRPSADEMTSARQNQARNRSGLFLPLDRWRVNLSLLPGVEGSDYINATPLTGYDRPCEFIITQHPLAHTVDDFWRMVWEHSVQTVVVLSPIDEQAAVRLVASPEWPGGEVGSPLRLVRALLRPAARRQAEPVVVVDRFGGTEAAMFCCLTTLAKQLASENAVDVYMYAKMCHMRRPGVWQTPDDLAMLYHAMECLNRPALPGPTSDQSEAEAPPRPSSRGTNTAPRGRRWPREPAGWGWHAGRGCTATV